MKLVIEGTQAYRKHRGWGRYNELLLTGLHLRASETISSSVFYHEDFSHTPLAETFAPSTHFQLRPIENTLERFTEIEENFQTSFIDRHFADCDLYHSVTEFPFYSKKVPLVCTIHELTTLVHKELFPSHWVAEFSRYLSYATQNAARLICPSSRTKTDLLEYFQVETDRIVVIPNGLKPCFKVDPAIKDPKNYFLYVGGINKPSKNFTRFFQAFQKYRSKLNCNCELIVVNSEFDQKSFHKQFAIKAAEEMHITLKTDVSDEELVQLYQAACALVYPSCYEGFGMPVSEALACGCPVLCDQDLPVVKEWLSGHIIGADIRNVDAFAESLQRMNKDSKKNRQEAMANAKKVQEMFCLDGFIDSHIDVYGSI